MPVRVGGEEGSRPVPLEKRDNPQERVLSLREKRRVSILPEMRKLGKLAYHLYPVEKREKNGERFLPRMRKSSLLPPAKKKLCWKGGRKDIT